MIKMVLDTNEGQMFIFGLSYMNLDKLREGRPIAFDTSEVGIEGSKFVIMAGETEEAIADELESLIPGGL